MRIQGMSESRAEAVLGDLLMAASGADTSVPLRSLVADVLRN